MGVWEDHNWSDAKALNGKAFAILFTLPFIYYSTDLVNSCPADSFFVTEPSELLTYCGGGTNFAVLVLLTAYLPMYLLSLVQGNGWMNDLYWTVIPLMALYHYSLIVMRFVPNLNTFRMGMLWGVLLVWSLRLTYNYIRREDWTFGAREDFRFERFREQYGVHWLWMSIFVQYISQHITEVLFSIPYYFVLRDTSITDGFDIFCVCMAMLCVLIAGLADEELRDWVLNPKNRDKVLKTGLWSFSRHPNYFAESTFHWCIGIWALRTAPSYWILICPGFNTLILVITTGLTEAKFLRGKKRKEYLEYQKTTRVW